MWWELICLTHQKPGGRRPGACTNTSTLSSEAQSLFSSHVSILTEWVSILMIEKRYSTSQYLAMFQVERRWKGKSFLLLKLCTLIFLCVVGSLPQGLLLTPHWPALYHVVTLRCKEARKAVAVNIAKQQCLQFFLFCLPVKL